jgi:hypothetical protein
MVEDSHSITAYPGEIITLLRALDRFQASDWQKRTALRILHLQGIGYALKTVEEWGVWKEERHGTL